MGLDEQKALEVYQTCMKAEVSFFKSATGDEDIPSEISLPPVRLASVQQSSTRFVADIGQIVISSEQETRAKVKYKKL